jgi:3'-5' exoribonuclease
MFPEALMLHYLDDLDSKMEAMRAQFERESSLDGAWTSYNASLGRPLLNTEKFLKTTKTAPDELTSEPVSDHHESRAESAAQNPSIPGLVHSDR